METPPLPPVAPPSQAGYPPSGFTPSGFYPAEFTPGGHPTPQQPPNQNKRNGVAGAAAAIFVAVAKFGAAALALLAKFGLIFLKLFKFGGTLISMLVSLVIFVAIFGPLYGVGVLVLIAVHESGHMLMAWAEGVPVTTPIFLGPFGALVRMKRDVTPQQEAVIAIGGPVVGTIGAFCFFAAGLMTPAGKTHFLLIALAYFGCFINLFNLVPFGIFDGGRIAGALSPWAGVAGLVVFTPFILLTMASGTFNPFLIFIILIGAFSTWQRFQAMRRGELPPPMPSRVKWMIGMSYLGIAAVALLGMSASHSQLVDGGYAPHPNSYSTGT